MPVRMANQACINISLVWMLIASKVLSAVKETAADAREHIPKGPQEITGKMQRQGISDADRGDAILF